MLRPIAATVCASILFSASTSRADQRAAPQPVAAAQPPPGPAAQPPPVAAGQPPPGPASQPPPGTAAQPPPVAPQPPPPGYGPPPYYYPPPYYMPAQQLPPRVIKWNEGEEIPPGYHKGTQARIGLVVSGSVLFGAAWLPSAIVGTFSSPLLAIPVAGPFAILPGGDAGGVATFWLVFDAIQQVAGISMFIAGFAAPQTVLLRADVRSAKTWWLPTPMSFGNGSTGLGIQGTM